MKTILEKALKDISESIGRAPQVALLGFGATNRALLDILLDVENIDITVRHSRLGNEILPKRVTVVSSEGALDGICEDVLFPSPSIRRERLAIPSCSRVITDYSLLFDTTPERLFTVSGSDGKSTTVAMAAELLSPTFPDIFTGGNIGTPLWQADATASAFLLELSSFTLRYSLPRGGRALITNITPNHLDWHSDLKEYEDTKLSLIKAASEPILNLDDSTSERAARELRTFCLISATRTSGEIFQKYNTAHTVTVEGGVIAIDGEALLTVKDIKHREKHNLYNLASAIALSIGYTDTERIRAVAGSFTALSQRCERFTVGGISFISSSIDTTPLRTRTTLSGLDERVRLILGGKGKGLSLDPLRDALVKYADKIAIYGEISREMTDFIESDEDTRMIPHRSFRKLSDAIAYVIDGANEGDTVLLSPAATSYGEFTDYAERGRFFKSYALQLVEGQNRK